MKYNISELAEYRTQCDNKLRPSGTCGPTGAANALLASDIPLDRFPANMQPEDYITSILQTNEAYERLKKQDPGAKYNPWNTSYLIAWAVNKAVGKQVCKVETLGIADMIFHLVKEESAIVAGGRFTAAGHFICIVGFETDQDDILGIESSHDVDLKQLKGIIIDDSWGDYRTHYKKHNGNDVLMPLADFRMIVMKGENTKTCQVYYRRYAA